MIEDFREPLMYAVYYAPRGRVRLYNLGREVAQRHLFPTDLLVGVIGAEGAGKSTLIRGTFPGLELTNDDEGINLRSAPLFDDAETDHLGPHTYHIDVRYEQAFHQLWEISAAVMAALKKRRRVVVEHFDALFPHLGFNAHVLIGIGEEVIVARPNVFGPEPDAIHDIVYRTVTYRKMAHSAEDITNLILNKQYGRTLPLTHSDVKHGFVIGFSEDPGVDLAGLEAAAKEVIARDLPIVPADDEHIRIGDEVMYCTGVRTHVASSGEIECFRLLPELKVNPITQQHLLVGMVGDRTDNAGFDHLLKIVG
ncbi:MAG: alanine-tRNA synthetase second additional domain-containing protein [Telmatospirillum sp.]|nr:alanine-tRNA synthetase second additional domain-containing protein [Telmatospirillum sp.]